MWNFPAGRTAADFSSAERCLTTLSRSVGLPRIAGHRHQEVIDEAPPPGRITLHQGRGPPARTALRAGFPGVPGTSRRTSHPRPVGAVALISSSTDCSRSCHWTRPETIARSLRCAHQGVSFATRWELWLARNPMASIRFVLPWPFRPTNHCGTRFQGDLRLRVAPKIDQGQNDRCTSGCSRSSRASAGTDSCRPGHPRVPRCRRTRPACPVRCSASRPSACPMRSNRRAGTGD